MRNDVWWQGGIPMPYDESMQFRSCVAIFGSIAFIGDGLVKFIKIMYGFAMP